jgi:Na+(H+)/acetate symporter ActP
LAYARDWLTERIDKQAQRECRVELVKWAVLAFVVLGVIVDVMLLHKWASGREEGA